MANGLLDRLRGARGFELFAALALAALVALLLANSGGGGGEPEKTGLEARLEGMLERIDGAGSVSAMIAQGEDGTATGVLIVADGLEDVQTYLRLQRAVATLLDIPVSQIEIIGANGAIGGGA